MRLVFVGPPGSGKGTQAKLLRERYGLTLIGTGDILRDAVKRRTPLGRRVESCLASGGLVPDDLVNEVVADLFRRDDHPVHFVLDGYPRTLAQAEALDGVLRQAGLDIDHVLLFVVPEEELIRRLGGRRLEEHRSDDGEETVRRRIALYNDNTKDLIDYYRRKGLLRVIDATQDVEQVHQQIVPLLGAQAG
jgi:adenylate kinase